MQIFANIKGSPVGLKQTGVPPRSTGGTEVAGEGWGRSHKWCRDSSGGHGASTGGPDQEGRWGRRGSGWGARRPAGEQPLGQSACADRGPWAAAANGALRTRSGSALAAPPQQWGPRWCHPAGPRSCTAAAPSLPLLKGMGRRYDGKGLQG